MASSKRYSKPSSMLIRRPGLRRPGSGGDPGPGTECAAGSEDRGRLSSSRSGSAGRDNEMPLTPQDRSTWPIVIEEPPDAIVGRAITLHVAFVPEHARPSGAVVVGWTIDGEVQAVSGLMLNVQPREPRRVVVRVEAARPTASRTATLVLQVRPRAARDDLADTQVELRKVERQQAVVAGLIIAVTGYFLFRAPSAACPKISWRLSVGILRGRQRCRGPETLDPDHRPEFRKSTPA